MTLPRDDLDLIDALVWCGAISRVTAREVATQAQPGRVATCIMERGLCLACGPSYVIVERLAKAEKAEHDGQKMLAEALAYVDKHEFRSGPGVAVPLLGPRDYAPNIMSCTICLQRDAAVGRGGCAECLAQHMEPDQPETD